MPKNIKGRLELSARLVIGNSIMEIGDINVPISTYFMEGKDSLYDLSFTLIRQAIHKLREGIDHMYEDYLSAGIK